MPDGSLLPAGHRIGPYVVLRLLGRGGMGVVFAARDERLGRDVALKMIAGPADATALARFWREARAAASVNHPHVCQIFDVLDTSDGVCLAMELLQGEPLDQALARGPLPPPDAARVALAVLDALQALHAGGLLHRDVKPSNVFLTPHGPKLLDFGLARPAVDPFHDGLRTVSAATGAGTLVGTPQYMSPEQLRGGDLDARSDVYAMGALLFHMLGGRPPFVGPTFVDVAAAALYENPPALQGPASVVAMDRVIRRALQKDAALRYATATLMAADLAAVPLEDTATRASIPVRVLTRVVVPPIRIARANPDLQFLSSGLAESVSASIAGRQDLVVRSPAVARRWFDPDADPKRVATDADVDMVLAATLMDSGRQVRLALQLVEGTTSTVIGARTIVGTLDDIFELEDRLTQASTELLSYSRAIGDKAGDDPIGRQGGPAGAGAGGGEPASGAATRADIPANNRAFELFLRGLEHARDLSRTPEARDLFLAAIREDPGFAPAWAGLGRCHRVYGKFFADSEPSLAEAEACFRRALQLAPQLPLTHRYLTHLESEQGRATEAIGRLLQHATSNRNDAQLFAGLVHACRYAGLIDASVAAHAEAQRLDPTVDTSIDYTYLQIAENAGDVDRFLAELRNDAGPHGMLTVIAINCTPERYLTALARVDRSRVPPHYALTIDATTLSVTGPIDAARAKIEEALLAHYDPEALFVATLCLCVIREDQRALEVLEQAVRRGFTPARMLRRHPVFARLRSTSAFQAIEAEARERAARAAAVFEQHGGREMLGVPDGADQLERPSSRA